MNARQNDNPRKSGPPIDAQAQGVSTLRKLLFDAIADESEGLEPDVVFDRLESNYDALEKLGY